MNGAHVFNWHNEEPEGFLGWLLVNLVAGIDPQVYRTLRVTTDGFTHVELALQLNGVELDVRSFLAGVQATLDHEVKRAVEDWVSDQPGVHRLRDLLDETERAFGERLRELACEAGIEWPTA